MKILLIPFLLGAVAASPSVSPLVTPGTVISQPDLKTPLGKEWSVAKGTWVPANGVLTAHEIVAQKHIPVIHVETGPGSMMVELDFQLGAVNKSLVVLCDGTKHIGRAVITSKSVSIVQNMPDPVTGKPTNGVLSKQAVDLKPDAWQHLRVEYAGDKMAAWLNDVSVTGEHPYLATPKKHWGIAAVEGVQIRNLRITAGQDAPAPPVKQP